MTVREIRSKARQIFTFQRVMVLLAGSAILSFGMYNIHQQTNITEGGVLGLNLLLNHWLGLSVAFVAPLLDVLCYALAFFYLGKRFLAISIVSTLMFSGCYKIWELFPPLLPNLSNIPILAAVIGGVFVGIGVGIVVRQGGSCGGDDALALVISQKTGWKLSTAYLITDLSVLLVSLSYIPIKRIIYSLITVTISSNLIELLQGKRKARKDA